MKVTICGAAGGIGQPLSLLMKINPHVSELCLFDVVNSLGVGKDLSHINTRSDTSAFLPDDDGLKKALTGSGMVIIPAGIPRKPGMTRDDLFSINGGIIRDLAVSIAENAPDAFVLVISNPVNSTVPIVSEVFKKYGVYQANKIMGVTTLDTVRANKFITEVGKGGNPDDFDIRVIGGHSGETIVPVFSLGAPAIYNQLTEEQKDSLIHRVQYAGDEVVQAKNGAGSATLSMAYAGYKLADALLRAISGESNVVESVFVGLDNTVISGAQEAKSIVETEFADGEKINYFALPVLLSSKGAEAIDVNILSSLDDREKESLKMCCDQLGKSIVKGTKFIKG